MQTNNRPSWIGYLKDGAETILKEAKSASEKVVDAVVQASALYTTDRLQSEHLSILPVTNRLIAISFPNPTTLETVAGMSTQRYSTSAYFLNLTETNYPADVFGGRLLNCGWSSSTPPLLNSLCHVLEVADRWLLAAPENVIFVHSQDGTGSAPLFIASYLIACGLYKSASSALQYYANCLYFSSPSTSVGIINVSQRRYLDYVETLLLDSNKAVCHKVILVDLILSSVPLFSVNRANCKPFFEVYENEQKILSTLRDPTLMRTFTSQEGPVTLPVNVCVSGDVRIAVYHARNYIGGKMSAIKMFQLCFNTAFINPECGEIKLPKSRLDGISRNESKFHALFNVSFSISVQLENQPKTSPYGLSISSQGTIPPICCSSEEEFRRILHKAPDKGPKKSSLTSSESRSSTAYCGEFEEDQDDQLDPASSSEEKLINLSGNSPERVLAMSDPVTRKTPNKPTEYEEVLMDLLAPSPMSQSSSAPNLAAMDGCAPFSSMMPNSCSDSRLDNGQDLLAMFEAETASPQIHQRNKSVNLLDFSQPNEDEEINCLAAVNAIPKVDLNPASETPSILLDPFIDEITNEPSSLQDPFLTPTPAHVTAHTNHFPCSIPLLQHHSGSNSPATNGSRNASPRPSPSQTRRNDPFSDFVLDTKTEQINFEKVPSAQPNKRTPSPPTLGTMTPPTQGTKQNPAQKYSYSSGPNYFASAGSASGRVFSGDSKPRQTSDTFADLLPGEEFAKNPPIQQQTLLQQRREELERTTDPIKLKIMDWTRGKEDNIRALLGSLGDVLWDGEARWSQPGMHLMISPTQVKKMYRNASRVVHPDKQVGTANEDLAKAIQTELNDAYTAFEDTELH